MKESVISPVAIFGFKRPQHTAQVLAALSNCELIEQTEIYLFCDGPKMTAEESECRNIDKVRQLFRGFTKAKTINIFISETNKGLNRSIEQGIEEVFKKHDRVIVVEDDVIVAVSFLKFMNTALNLLKDEAKVFHISGYTPKMNMKQFSQEVFFMRNPQVWGWATWADRWKHYKRDPKKNYELISRSQKDIRNYNFSPAIDYYPLLKKTIDGDQTIWDTKWSSSIYVMEGLTLYPFKSLTINIGLDNTGEHCDSNSLRFFQPNNFNINNMVPLIPSNLELKENVRIRKKIQIFLSRGLGRKEYYKTLFKSMLGLIN